MLWAHVTRNSVAPDGSPPLCRRRREDQNRPQPLNHSVPLLRIGETGCNWRTQENFNFLIASVGPGCVRLGSDSGQSKVQSPNSKVQGPRSKVQSLMSTKTGKKRGLAGGRS